MDGSAQPSSDTALRQVLERTVPRELFSAQATHDLLARTVADDDTVGLDAYVRRDSTILDDTNRKRQLEETPPPRLERAALCDRTSASPAACDATGRYVLAEMLGAGATGRVYSVHDRDLNRDVAVKVFASPDPSRAKRLLGEARTIARLEHPGILPIHDIDTTADGQVYFVMRRVEGHTVGALVRKAEADGARPVQIASPAAVVRIFLKVCDALRYAHYQGVIHQDIKPDNIMVGTFGEVLVLDWGSSSAAHSDGLPEGTVHLVGTPAYMSPEQARRESADERSDVYCLGASLFQTLTLRHPTWGSTPEEFWAKKTAGAIDTLTEGERSHLPHQLVAIVHKALEPNPADRYQTMEELAQDLERYQTGQAIGWQPFRPVILPVSSNEELAEKWIAYRAPGWSRPREAVPGRDPGWRIEDGVLHGSNQRGYDNIAWRGSIPGDIRVEWDVTPLVKAENLNCFIGGRQRREAYVFHVNANSIAGNCLVTKEGNLDVLETRILEEPFETGRTYHMSMEKEGDRIRLFLNGNRVFDFSDPDPLTGPAHHTFGFENSSGNSIEIRNARAWYRPLPLELSPLSIANQYLEDGLYQHALAQYRAASSAYPGTEPGETARFKGGLCLVKLDRLGEAVEAFEEYERKNPSGPLVAVSRFERAKVLLRLDRSDAAETIYREIARDFPGSPVCERIVSLITDSVPAPKEPEAILRNPEREMARLARGATVVRQWCSVLGVSPRHNAYLKLCAYQVLQAGETDALLTMYPDQHEECSTALSRLGRHEEVLGRYPHLRRDCARALLNLNRPAEALARYPEHRAECARALLHMGRHEELLANYPDQREACAQALLTLDRPGDVIEGEQFSSRIVWLACVRANRMEDAFRRFGPSSGGARKSLRLRGDQPAILAQDHDENAVAEALADMGRWEELLARCPGDQANCAYALVMLGRAEEAFEKFPMARRQMANALIEVGEPERVLQMLPAARDSCAQALNWLGRHDEVLDEYTASRSECVRALTARGDYERIGAEYGEVHPGMYLIAMGRAEYVLNTYSGNSTATMDALLSRGRMQEVVDRYADFSDRVAPALLLLGRAQESLERYGHLPGFACSALLALGRPSEVLDRYGREPSVAFARVHARAALAAAHLSGGDTAGALDLLKAVESERVDMGRRDMWFVRFLFAPLVRHLTHAEPVAVLHAACEAIVEKRRSQFEQELWHTAAFMLGRCSEREFLLQPRRDHVDPLLLFAKALAFDCEGAAEAFSHYALYAQRPAWERGINPSRDAFVEWRLRVLGEGR